MPWRRYTTPVRLPFPKFHTKYHTNNPKTDEEARPAASKVLSRWRPEVTASQQPRDLHNAANGAQQLTTNA